MTLQDLVGNPDCWLSHTLPYFSHLQITDNLVGDVKGTDIEIISQEIFDQDPLTRIQNLKVCFMCKL